MSKTPPTLFAWLGGQPALDLLIARFYDRVAADTLLAPLFAGMSADHRQAVADFIGEVFGGPRRYTDGGARGHATMVAKHLGKHLSEPQRRRWVGLLLDTADEAGVPDDPEFRSALVGYLEWGSRLAVINSQLDESPVAPGAPMPTWGWGETGGPYEG
ncbi:MAG: group II truncated hemoglobin [Myxococcales bacterium]|nr:group II truncated hemoglobin [Myxococcales bacterium]MCB9734679.1 globin [Deltaproteobacteria bacterium]